MTKLKLSALEDDKPVKVTVELPAAIHRDLVAYAQILARASGQTTIEPAKLIAPMSADLWQRIERSQRYGGPPPR